MRSLRPAVVVCEGPNGLGAIRGLAKMGVPTIAVAREPREVALWSRYPFQKLCVLPAQGEGGDEALLELLLKLPEPNLVLIPTSDRDVSLIAKNRRRLAEGFCFCIPSDEVVEALLDKRREIELMIRLQVPIPKSVGVLPGKAEELGQALELPTIVKPRSFAHKKLLRSKNIVLRTLQELELFYASHRDVLWGLVAQEAIPGDDTMLCKCDCTFNRSSEMVEAFTFRKLRTAPSHFGVASFAISETNREVVELAERIGRALRYVGPVNIEFKFDHRDQQYKYIEMNPRLGLCNYFGTVCGVNNAWNTYRLALGEDLPPQPRQQRDGTVYCCLFADLYARVKDGEPVRSIALHYLSYWDHPHAGPYHAWRDPMPGVVTTCRELGKLGRGVARRVLAPIQRQLGGGRR